MNIIENAPTPSYYIQLYSTYSFILTFNTISLTYFISKWLLEVLI
jgi:hypothetical protein